MIVAVAFLGGCSGKPGEKFVGKWQEKERKETTMQISRNGEGFILNMATTKSTGQKNAGSVPAIIKDGVLSVANGPFTSTVTHMEADDELFLSTFGGNLRFTRVK